MTLTKRQTKKKIYDWSELDEAVTEQRRLSKQTPVSEKALERAANAFGRDAHIAQLGERVIAVASPNNIRLEYLFTPKGGKLDDSRLHSSVRVYPAAGARTTYRVDNSVNGWFANANLPMNAGDRTTQSRYKSNQWFYGQAGVYQKGTGPYYADVGPDCSNVSLEQVIEQIQQMTEKTSEAWREAAVSLASRIAEVVAPFRDTVIRYELQLERDRFCVGGYYRDADGYHNSELCSTYGINVRLKCPHVSGESGWEMVPDFVAQVSGPPGGFEDPAKVLYGVILCHPQGRNQLTEWRCPYGEPNFVTGLSFSLSRSPVRIIEAARQWAAGRIYIPCS